MEKLAKLSVVIELPTKLQEQILQAAWWDGCRTGFIAGVLLLAICWVAFGRRGG